MVALDPALMVGLPPAVTAATGMDAMTHAVEAFIGDWATPYTDRMALAAVGMIWNALPRAYGDGADLAARETMALIRKEAQRIATDGRPTLSARGRGRIVYRQKKSGPSDYPEE